MNEITNLWKEDTDENIVKSWLVGLTDGQTYSINDRFLPRITTPLFCGNFDCIEAEWDEIIGPCIRCKIDDELLEPQAQKIVKGLNDFIARINADPNRYCKKQEMHKKFLCQVIQKGEDNDSVITVLHIDCERHEAVRWLADEVIRQLQEGDGENGGKGSLKNCYGDIWNCLFNNGRFDYADLIFAITERA